MKEFKSGFNPFASENLSTFLTVLVVLGVLVVLTISIDKYIIPHLNPDNRFVKWWKNHIVDEDPHA